MKNSNERCPFHTECDRKCVYQMKEIECPYYHANAMPGMELEDQEEKRYLDDGIDSFEDAEEAKTGSLVMLPVNSLYPHPDNPRKDLGDLTELADSIKANGIFQNLTVIPGHKLTSEEWAEKTQQYKRNPTDELRTQMNSRISEDGYTVIIGHRRLAAAKMAGLSELPCVIVEMSTQEQLKTMLVENMQRSDLTTYEQAQGFQLMLDMGATVETISKDSGFSVSTIRRRVKLLELDHDKFRKAEARGATLMDYMELDKIEDQKRKNDVLDAIGTPNFRNMLQSAIDTEKFIRKMDGWETEIAKFAEKITERGIVNGERVPMEYKTSFDKWSGSNTVEHPSDYNSTKYWYIRSSSGIVIYKEPKAYERTDEDLEREARRAKDERIEAELREIRERHFELRNEFVSSLSQSTVKKHFSDVAEFAAFSIIGNGCYRRDEPDIDAMNLIFDLDYDDETDYDDIRKSIAPKMKEAPEKGILGVLYAMEDNGSQGYWGRSWNREKQMIDYVYAPNDDLDRLYMLLTKLGYEVSDEEAEMMNGTHALLRQEVES